MARWKNGLRIKLSGKWGAENLAERISEVLTDFEKEGPSVELDSVNLYFNMKGCSGCDLSVATVSGKNIIEVVEYDSGRDFRSLSDEGLLITTKSDAEEAREGAHRIREERLKKARKESFRVDEEMEDFKRNMAIDHGVDSWKYVAQTVGRIKSRRAILKYIDESEVPESGIVYRLSMLKERDGCYDVKIYSEDFELIKIVRKKP